jgi:hypothetical protein
LAVNYNSEYLIPFSALVCIGLVLMRNHGVFRPVVAWVASLDVRFVRLPIKSELFLPVHRSVCVTNFETLGRITVIFAFGSSGFFFLGDQNAGHSLSHVTFTNY